MAGQKETPRQSMINLMYLVLTAMLALQVSSSILDKFLFLNSSLEYARDDAQKTNTATFELLAKEVENNKTDAAKSALKKAERIHEDTEKMILMLSGLKEEMIKEAGGRDESGHIKNPKEETKIEVMMVGAEGAKNGRAYQLEKDLNDYVKRLNMDTNLGLELLAHGNDKSPYYKNDPMQRNKDFAQANFAQTPLAAAMAVLTQKETEVLRYEALALKKLGADAKGQIIEFDQIGAMASAETNTVANGMKYKAEMFIYASASGIKPKMKVNGESIKVIDGKGQVEFAASGGTLEGIEKEWTGEITIKNKGKDTTFTFNKKYKVVKPVMVIQSDAVQALYEGCGNELNVTVPSLGSSYDPKFSGSGARFIPGGGSKLIVVPNVGTRQVSLSVSSGGQMIGTENIRVRPVPSPTIKMAKGGVFVDAANPVRLTPNMQPVAIPDEHFATFLPKEANYQVNSWEAKLVRGIRPIARADNSVASLMAQARSGDQIVIHVKSVVRNSFYLRTLLPVKLNNSVMAFTVSK